MVSEDSQQELLPNLELSECTLSKQDRPRPSGTERALIHKPHKHGSSHERIAVSNSPLRSPFRNFTFDNYPALRNLSAKLSNCGVDSATLISKVTGEVKSVTLYCDNRMCLNPLCQSHRLYKYRSEHHFQIDALNKNMRKPKAWVFTTSRLPYPIDRGYCQKRLLKLVDLLDKKRHRKFGSNSLFSAHMEIKLNADSWYLHFHVVSGGISNLRFVRQRWGYQIKYEDAINPGDLSYYVSKYASKVPYFPNRMAYLEYGSAVHKLQMHRFSATAPPDLRESEWVIIDRKSRSTSPAFFELTGWLGKYLDDYGFGS